MAAGASASAAVLQNTHRASVRQRERARNSFFMGEPPKRKKFMSRIDDFWGAVKKKMSAAFTPGAGCVKM
ncbi:hypothetical protein FBDF15_05570 [Faecalibacterium duncaniae]